MDILNNPLLMALLASMQGAQGGPPQSGLESLLASSQGAANMNIGAAAPVQSNPNIYLENGVYKNQPLIPNMPAPDPLMNAPFVLEGDYQSKAFYDDLREKQQLADAAALVSRRESEQHQLKMKELAEVAKYEKAIADAKNDTERANVYMNAVGEIGGNSNLLPQDQQRIMDVVTAAYEKRRVQQPDKIAEIVAKYRETMTDDQIITNLADSVVKDKSKQGLADGVRAYLKANPRVGEQKSVVTPTPAPTPVQQTKQSQAEHPYSVYPKMGQAMSQRYSGDEILTAGKDLADGMKRVYGWSDEQVIQFLELYAKFVSEPLNKSLLKPIS